MRAVRAAQADMFQELLDEHCQGDDAAEKETLQRVQDGLFHLRKGLSPFVEARMKAGPWRELAALRQPRRRRPA